jgi:hypothetical protein
LHGMRKILVFILLALCGFQAWTQDSSAQSDADTTVQSQVIKRPVVKKPTPRPTDSLLTDSTLVDSSLVTDSSALIIDSALLFGQDLRPTISLFRAHTDTINFAVNPFFSFTNPLRYSVTIKKWEGKEAIFYSILGLLIFFAFVKNGFSRYVSDLFKTYFRTTVKQKQTKEQLQQSPLPSLLLNVFFVLSIGMFLALLLQYFQLGLDLNFWLLYLYCILGLISIYLVKFISLKLFGWIFQVSESTDAYIFIVFATNKIIGIALLPFLVLLAFTYGMINEAAMSLSIMVIFALLAYRFFLSFLSIRRQLSVSFFHFLLYLFAFEIIPLLLINKLLFSFLGETS